MFEREYLEVREKEIAQLAPFVGAKETTAKSCIESVIALRERVKKLCGLPTTLKEVGVKKEDLAKIASRAPDDGSSFYNPREVTATDLMPYLERAWGG